MKFWWTPRNMLNSPEVKPKSAARTISGGDISGEILELVPDKKIVQSWRYSDWPEGVYSKATFELEAIEKGTRLTFTQSGVPDDKYEDIKQGWKDYYWAPMKAMLEQ
jgi:activator of HSP90 ATPase